MADINDLQKQVDELKKELDGLQQKRVFQQDITPQAVKNRHQGEANSYIYGGKTANKPTSGFVVNTNSYSVYFDYQTNKLYIWNGNTWISTTLS